MREVVGSIPTATIMFDIVTRGFCSASLFPPISSLVLNFSAKAVLGRAAGKLCRQRAE